jgi:hypothetical protein
MLTASDSPDTAFRRARSDEVALHVGKPPEYGDHQAAGAGSGIGPRLCKRAELRTSIHDAFDDREQIEGAASKSINSGHRHDVPSSDVLEELQEFAPVGLRAAGLLPVDFAAPFGAKLVKLRVERLANGTDASVPEATIL